MAKEYGRIGLICLLVLGLGLIVPGCAKKQTAPDVEEVEVVEEEVTVVTPPVDDEASILAAVEAALQLVHFDFDKYNLRDGDRLITQKNNDALKRLTNPQIQIQGYCDDRGTVEYNLALGQKRADSVRDYLVSLGMPAASISTISYGKENPLDPASNEAAYAMNRRAQIVIQK